MVLEASLLARGGGVKGVKSGRLATGRGKGVKSIESGCSAPESQRICSARAHKCEAGRQWELNLWQKASMTASAQLVP